MKSEKYKCFDIEIVRDEISFNPRDEVGTKIGTLAVVNNRYFLGDETVTKDTVTDILNDDGLISLPVYAHVHGDVKLSTKDFADRFDSGMAGVIYVDKSDNDYINSYNSNEELVKEALRGEVEEYSRYLSGDVLGYVIRLNGECIDSCWGFYDTFENVLIQAKEAADCIDVESCTIIIPDNNSGIGKEVCNGFKN